MTILNRVYDTVFFFPKRLLISSRMYKSTELQPEPSVSGFLHKSLAAQIMTVTHTCTFAGVPGRGNQQEA